MRSSKVACGVVLLAVATLTAPLVEAAEGDARPEERFAFRSYTEVGELFERPGYTPETWQAGIRAVPRVYLTDVAPRWRDRTSKEVSVTTKKRIFFRAMAPLALRSNELLLEDRARVEALAARVRAGTRLQTRDRDWLGATAQRLKVTDDADTALSPDQLDELRRRFDVVPVSLAPAQGAEESGWGTSPFAAEGKALIGQWTFSGEGIKPEQQRAALGDHRIAAFETPLESMMAYMHDFSTHPAYADLRARRAELRAAGERISGFELARALTRDSERGQGYVDSQHAVMRVDVLDPADDAYHGDGPTISPVAVGEGAE